MSNEPITRKEMFMAKASGQNVNTPKPITREEKFLERIAENGGKATSWKDLGEKTVMGDTLTWDGDKDGHYNINDIFYHVSDIVPTLEELQQGGTVGVATGGTLPFNSESVQMISDSLVAIITNDDIAVIVALTDNITMDSEEDIPTVFEKAGVYFAALGVGETQVRSLTINGYNGFERTEITPIPEEYLPSKRIVMDVRRDENTESGDCLYTLLNKSDLPNYQTLLKWILDGVVFDVWCKHVEYRDNELVCTAVENFTCCECYTAGAWFNVSLIGVVAHDEHFYLTEYDEWLTYAELNEKYTNLEP